MMQLEELGGSKGQASKNAAQTHHQHMWKIATVASPAAVFAKSICQEKRQNGTLHPSQAREPER
jgi:hypothetical protein